jgi:DNA-directed RNA polymerase specialized sigma24 family protein
MTSTRTFELDQRVRGAFEAGDLRAAAECIVDTLGADLVRVIHARFRDEQLTAEVFSRVAEDLWVGLPTFTFRCSVRAWVFTLARNAGSRYLDRELRRERAHVPLSRAPELVDAVQRSFAQTFPGASTDPTDRLAALRAELDEDDQLLLTLRIDRELDFREIAVVMLGDADADRGAVVREAARLRKRFQTLKERLRARWQAATQR